MRVFLETFSILKISHKISFLLMVTTYISLVRMQFFCIFPFKSKFKVEQWDDIEW